MLLQQSIKIFPEVSITVPSSPKLILASSSTYRQQQLEQLGLTVQCVPHKCDEQQWKDRTLSAQQLAQTLATEKAKSIQQEFSDQIILGADQVAVCEDQILSKPLTHQAAIEQLDFMQGKMHSLFTAFTLLSPSRTTEVCDHTQLTMKSLSTKQIERYLLADQPYDCAGSYMIENRGITLFNKIQTEDFTAIIGLPLMKLTLALKSVGIILP